MNIIGQSDHLLIEAQITNIGYLENKQKIIFNTTKLKNLNSKTKLKTSLPNKFFKGTVIRTL